MSPNLSVVMESKLPNHANPIQGSRDIMSRTSQKGNRLRPPVPTLGGPRTPDPIIIQNKTSILYTAMKGIPVSSLPSKDGEKSPNPIVVNEMTVK